MSDLTLYAESSWVSPWVFHVMVALEEKRLPYKLELVPMPIPQATREQLQAKAVIGKVPLLAHGDLWITESLAISEYLAETFPAPGHPRLFPANLGERARARQVMSFVRTSLFALREDRPTSSVFSRQTTQPLTEKGKADADELLRVASALVKPGKTTMFDDYCIADTDLTLALMRLVANQDPMPQHLIDYAVAQWERRSVRRYLAHIPTTH